MRKTILDNISGPSGFFGYLVAKCNDPESLFSFVPKTPAELLLFLSTILVLCQIIHWLYRFHKYLNRHHKRRSGDN